MEKIKVGDKVILKSGSPVLTVNRIFEARDGSMQYECCWFDSKGYDRASFSRDTIEPAVSETKVNISNKRVLENLTPELESLKTLESILRFAKTPVVTKRVGEQGEHYVMLADSDNRSYINIRHINLNEFSLKIESI